MFKSLKNMFKKSPSIIDNKQEDSLKYELVILQSPNIDIEDLNNKELLKNFFYLLYIDSDIETIERLCNYIGIINIEKFISINLYDILMLYKNLDNHIIRDFLFKLIDHPNKYDIIEIADKDEWENEVFSMLKDITSYNTISLDKEYYYHIDYPNIKHIEDILKNINKDIKIPYHIFKFHIRYDNISLYDILKYINVLDSLVLEYNGYPIQVDHTKKIHGKFANIDFDMTELELLYTLISLQKSIIDQSSNASLYLPLGISCKLDFLLSLDSIYTVLDSDNNDDFFNSLINILKDIMDDNNINNLENNIGFLNDDIDEIVPDDSEE